MLGRNGSVCPSRGVSGSQELNGQRVNTAKKANSQFNKRPSLKTKGKEQYRKTTSILFRPLQFTHHKTMSYTTYKYKEKLLINRRSKLQEKLKPSVPLNRKLCQKELGQATGM